MITKFRKIFNYFYLLISLRSLFWANQILEYGIDLTQSRFVAKGKKLELQDFNLLISYPEDIFFLKGIYNATFLLNQCNAKFSKSHDGKIFVKINDIEVSIQTQEEIQFLREIFFDGIYNFIPSRPTVVFDIGMNVGFSSLFFASKQNVKVVSFEPFEKTYAQAMFNYSLNPKLFEKIKCFNFGLASANYSLSTEYCHEYRGSVGINAIPNKFRENEGKICIEKIDIKDIRDIFSQEIKNFENYDIILKIDCEGAEYSIIEALSQSDQLCLVKCLMMEWHYKGPEKLIEFLENSEFFILSFFPKSTGTGMIYAINSKNQYSD